MSNALVRPKFKPVSTTDGTITLVAASPWHISTPAEVVSALDTRAVVGLSNRQVLERKAHYGLNRLAEAPPVPMWKRFLGQFTELIIWILISAAIIALALGEWLDALAILAIVFLNAILGFLQEEKAQRELASLRKRSAYSATAIRDGKQAIVAAEELVPGDVIELEAGDHIPADVRLIESFAFSVQEAALTGESVPVHKDAAGSLSEEFNTTGHTSWALLRINSRATGCGRGCWRQRYRFP